MKTHHDYLRESMPVMTLKDEPAPGILTQVNAELLSDSRKMRVA